MTATVGYETHGVLCCTTRTGIALPALQSPVWRIAETRYMIEIEHLIRYAPFAVGPMEIEHLIRYAELAAGLKPSAT